jgi:hypothetical protein
MVIKLELYVVTHVEIEPCETEKEHQGVQQCHIVQERNQTQHISALLAI